MSPISNDSNVSVSYGNDSAILSPYTIVEMLIIVTLGTALIICIVFGNTLVVASICLDNRLKNNKRNILIASLATADLLVGLLVMPLTLAYEIVGQWLMGALLCDLWLALDVLFCTASILNLGAISLDRYWSVTNPLSYPARRTSKTMGMMTTGAWLASLAISLPPLFGWRPTQQPNQCEVSHELGYVIYSALGSFYIPVIVLIAVYARIFAISHKQLRQRVQQTEKNQALLLASRQRGCRASAKQKRQRTTSMPNGPANLLLPPAGSTRAVPRMASGNDAVYLHTTATTNGADTVVLSQTIDNQKTLPAPETDTSTNDNDGNSGQATIDDDELPSELLNNASLWSHSDSLSSYNCADPSPRQEVNANEIKVILDKSSTLVTQLEKRMRQRAQLKKRIKRLKKKERQSTILLGLILIGFIACWLPFFIIYLLGAIDILVPDKVFTVFFWLGYCNSAVNPVIYTIFQRDFRRARSLVRATLNSANCRELQVHFVQKDVVHSGVIY